MATGSHIWHRHLRGDPCDLARRAGILFIVGSTCFALGSLPPYFLNMSAQAVGVTFFIGSVFFTSAGLTQLLELTRESGRPLLTHRKIWWALAVQLAGMVFFNVNTFRAAFLDVPSDEVNRLIWAPDFFGSVAFLVASHLAWLVVCGSLWCVRQSSPDWWMAGLNYLGSVFFMLSALGAFFLETTGEVVNITLVNAGTFLGAVCFLLGAYLLLPLREVPTASTP